MSSHQNTSYPQVLESNPDPFLLSNSTNKSSSLYPSLDSMIDNLFPDNDEDDDGIPTSQLSTTDSSVEQLLLNIPGSIVHLIDEQNSIELASGVLTVVSLRQGENVVAVLVRIGQDIQWPLAKDEASVKLDDSHYFFSLRLPSTRDDEDDDNELVNYGLTIASKGQENLLKELDGILERYSSFSVQKVSGKGEEVLVAKKISPMELEIIKDASAAYWTTLAPNVEDYSGSVSRAIAAGSGQLIKGILWCGDVTTDRLKWGNQFLRSSMEPCSKQTDVSPQALRRIKRVKRISKMSEKLATGILSGVVKVSGFFTSSIVNSKVGKKFFSLLPGEIVLASLDGFSRVFDAVEVAGKNVMSTTSTVTTGLVSHRYGEKAAEATNEALDAAGHVIGTGWAVLKIRNALNPKSAIKPTTLAKSAAKAAVAQAKSKHK